MNRSFFKFFCVLLTFFTLVACTPLPNQDQNQDAEPKQYKIEFIVEGEVYASAYTNSNSLPDMPKAPQKAGYTFEGWYWDKDVWTKPLTLSSLSDALLSETVSVYAKWSVLENYVPDNGAKSNVKAALICLHDDRSTYDKNFIDAFKTACANKGLTEDDYTIITDIPEGIECYNAATDFAVRGYDVVFGDSFAYEAFMVQAAKEFPNVQFCHATGTKAHTENLPNFQNAFASIYEGRYLTGVAAGMKLVELYGDAEGKVSDENAKIGYVAAFPYAEVISEYTAFYLGVKSIVKNATMEVRFTNSWHDETAEKTTAEALIQAGCKLISQHADSMGAPTACENAGIPNVAYNSAIDNNTFVIASRINWVPYFEYMLDCVLNSKDIDTDWTGTLLNNAVEITAVGKAAAPGTQAKLDEVAAKLKAGTLKVFDCSTFTVGGKPLTTYLADVDDMGDFMPETEAIKTENGITFFDECAFRSAPYFDIPLIDGIFCTLY